MSTSLKNGLIQQPFLFFKRTILCVNESISILHRLSHSRLMAMDPLWCVYFYLTAKSDRTPFTFPSDNFDIVPLDRQSWPGVCRI